MAAGEELPADIPVDLYLVRADRLVQNQDHGAARECLDVVLARQARSGMQTPAELWFRHARTAPDAGYAETVATSVVRCLEKAGRHGASAGKTA